MVWCMGRGAASTRGAPHCCALTHPPHADAELVKGRTTLARHQRRSHLIDIFGGGHFGISPCFNSRFGGNPTSIFPKILGGAPWLHSALYSSTQGPHGTPVFTSVIIASAMV